MKIELREKIKITPSEIAAIESVSNDRPRLSETLFDKPKISRASYSPETKQVESI